MLLGIFAFFYVKDLQSEKALVHNKGCYSIPQKTLLLHCLKSLVWSPAFCSVTYVHHYAIKLLTGVF